MFKSQFTKLELNSQSAEVSPTGHFNILDQVRVATPTSFALHVVGHPATHAMPSSYTGRSLALSMVTGAPRG